MNDLFLGIIAFSVLVMAVIQVAVIVFAARAARQVGEAVTRLEQEVKPIVASLQHLTAEAARASTSAAAQMERVQKTVDAVLDRAEAATQRVEETLATVQQGLLAPAREGMAFLQTLKGIFTGRDPRPAPGARPTHVDEEDPLFIG